MIATLHAIRRMPVGQRPKLFYGCEVWRDLDWLNDDEKVRLDTSGNDPVMRGTGGSSGQRWKLTRLHQH